MQLNSRPVRIELYTKVCIESPLQRLISRLFNFRKILTEISVTFKWPGSEVTVVKTRFYVFKYRWDSNQTAAEFI